MAKYEVGDMVSWNSSGGRAEGEIVRVQESGRLAIPDSSLVLNATEDDPAYLIRIYREGEPTDVLVGHRESALTKKGMNNAINYKGFPAQIKDLDRKEGIVTGYFAQFGSIDSDMDSIKPGAFAKTIMENGPEGKNRIMHLYQHDVNKPLGKPYLLKEDEFGLYFESKIIGTTYGEDVLKLYEAGVINEHSIGFKTVRNTPKEGFNEIEEVMLYEGSTVTFGANENTPFTGFKSMTATEAVQKMQTISKAFRKGDFTDDTFNLLEIQMKQLEQFIIDQYSQEKAEPVQTTQSEILPSDIDEAFAKLEIKLF